MVIILLTLLSYYVVLFGDLNLEDGIPNSTAISNYKILQLLSLDSIESNFLTTRYTQQKNTVNLGKQNLKYMYIKLFSNSVLRHQIIYI
jgi:hypothetical protein